MKNVIKIFAISKPIHKLLFLILTFVSLNSVLLQLINLTLKETINKISVNLDNGLTFTSLYPLMATFAVLTLTYVITNTVANRIGDVMAGRHRKYITNIFYKHIFDLPQSFFDSNLSGKILNQLNRGVYSIQGFTNSFSNFIFPTLLQSILTIGLVLYFSWPIGVLIITIFPVFVYLSYKSSKFWKEKEIKKNEFEDLSRGRISEVLQNMKLVKSLNAQNSEAQIVEDYQSNINKMHLIQSAYHHKYDFLRNLFLQFILFSIYAILFVGLINKSMDYGTFVFLISSIASLQTPFFVMSYLIGQLQSAESNTKEFFEILNMQPAKSDIISFEKLSLRDNFKIKFENVEFSYDSSKKVLNRIDFEIKNKEKVAIVGHSGAGKTTIINLILKFYHPTSGEIYLDEHKFSDTSSNLIREHITLVFQENELFSTSVRENVTYGNKLATEEEIISALKKANAYSFVSKLEKGIDTLIGERGIKLSGGQKQRIQIARAILADKPIIILDEATSSLDSKSEKLIQEAVESLTKDKMVIIIAHRFSTIQNVDKVLVLSDGKIVDQGKPSELAQREGIYKDLLNYQVEGNKKLLETFELS